MTSYADLEVGLHRWDADNYTIEMRFTQPDSDAEVRLLRDGPALLRFNADLFRDLELNPLDYGRTLGQTLLGDDAVRAVFAQARSTAQALGAVLRMRLFIGPSAPELHQLRWETLCDLDGTPLLMSEHLAFSRYLSSSDWQPVRLRPRADLRALVVIANPSNLSDYSLAPVDVAGELGRVQEALGDIAISTLASAGSATLPNLIAHLRQGNHEENPYDILYIVCHGSWVLGESWLWLEQPDGTALRVAGNELVLRLRELQQRPRLVVLASCQSFGSGSSARSDDKGVLATLGPRLAEAGIPAVIAMQGNITLQTVAGFMPTFFEALRRDGQVDAALAEARSAVRDRPDAWIPVLFMRLKSGRIWYVPGFGDERQAFEKWPAMLRYIQRGQCTPIIGARISESLLGSQYDIARTWADTYHFPLAPHEREDMPQVAQYLATSQAAQFPHEELIEHLRQELLTRYGETVPGVTPDASLSELFAAVGAYRRERDPADPYRVLADMPFPIYLTTNLSNLLTEALRAAGKDPQVEICRWNEDIEMLPSIYDDEPDYQPSVERPLVYHLFGIADEPVSLVLTEDDYFDFLIGVSANRDLIPIAVRQALADTALFFLGFRVDDWNFRVLFRSIMRQEGGSRRRKYAHIAAQILPEEGRFLEPERACRYLESYFQDSAISIFWGSSEDFVKELQQRLKASPSRSGR